MKCEVGELAPKFKLAGTPNIYNITIFSSLLTYGSEAILLGKHSLSGWLKVSKKLVQVIENRALVDPGKN